MFLSHSSQTGEKPLLRLAAQMAAHKVWAIACTRLYNNCYSRFSFILVYVELTFLPSPLPITVAQAVCLGFRVQTDTLTAGTRLAIITTRTGAVLGAWTLVARTRGKLSVSTKRKL